VSSGALSVREATKVYDPDGARVVALDRCSLEIGAGDFSVVVGPSGCGKTTLLNAIAGFHELSSGEIYLDGDLLSSPTKPATPGADRVVVFQNGALFPWMTILDNVAFGPLAAKGYSKEEAHALARQKLEDLGLAQIAFDYPGQISSGMRRRAEIARAMTLKPKVLLLDEPFRALDALTKTVSHQFLMEVYDRDRPTVFFITHDLDEAVFLASRVFVMTTRPATVKKILDVPLPRPRDYRLLATAEYQSLRDECQEAVREEARKAFSKGEREM
jgi:NitT/TauT family transport system ATP-binding protein